LNLLFTHPASENTVSHRLLPPAGRVTSHLAGLTERAILSSATPAKKISAEAFRAGLLEWQEDTPHDDVRAARQEASWRIGRNLETRGKWLELSQMPLLTLPGVIGQLSHLEHLDVLNARLQSVPPEVGQLERLRCLKLPLNDLRELPAQLANLRELRRLFLNNNQFAALPHWLGELAKLEQLHVPGNLLRELPEALQPLHNLRDLDAHNNLITELPGWLRSMKLRYLDVASNPIGNLPDFVEGGHNSLEALIQSHRPTVTSARVFHPAEGTLLGDGVVLHPKK
jgi:Leucine-rich repeat (LRR) protein